jgi:hypothetical protein
VRKYYNNNNNNNNNNNLRAAECIAIKHLGSADRRQEPEIES